MTVRYHATHDRGYFGRQFGIEPVAGTSRINVAAGDQGMFVRRPRTDIARKGAVPPLEAATGRWGLIPLFSPDGHDRFTHEAASETAATERNFLQPWKRGHRCVVVADALWEAVGDTGASVRIARADGAPFCIAGLWNGWRSPTGACVESFALLTIRADEDFLTQQTPADRPQRRPVILPDAWIDEWFRAPVEETAAFLRPYPMQTLVATPRAMSGMAQTAADPAGF